MASQTVLRWPLPSTGALNGCLLPAATLPPSSEATLIGAISLPPLVPSRRRHRAKCAETWMSAAPLENTSTFSNTSCIHAPCFLSKRTSSFQNDGAIEFLSSSSRAKRKSVGSISKATSEASRNHTEESSGKVESNRKRIAVFVSGGGSNYKAIQAAIDAGRVNGEVVVVVSDKPGCKATEFATERGVDVCAYPRSAKFAPEGLSAEDLVQFLREKRVDIVLLAGFLKLLPAELVKAFPRAILNIHPALLPAFGGKGFYGLRVHSAVIKSGAWFSGPTVHFIDENYDAGVIVAQRIVRVLPTDTPEELQARVLKEEHQLYPAVVAALCDGHIRWREDGVPILENETQSISSVPQDTSPQRNVQAII